MSIAGTNPNCPLPEQQFVFYASIHILNILIFGGLRIFVQKRSTSYYVILLPHENRRISQIHPKETAPIPRMSPGTAAQAVKSQGSIYFL